MKVNNFLSCATTDDTDKKVVVPMDQTHLCTVTPHHNTHTFCKVNVSPVFNARVVSFDLENLKSRAVFSSLVKLSSVQPKLLATDTLTC